MFDFVTLGNTYKKKLSAYLNGTKFLLKIFSNKQDSYFLDYHDGTYQKFVSNQNGYIQFDKQDCVSKRFSLAYDNYNIECLWLSKSEVSKLIIQQLRHLKCINVSENNLQYLVVSKCLLLQNLVANNNQLIQIDLTKNKMLKYVDLSNNYIQKIDLSKNKNIQQLSINNNLLTSIFVPQKVQRLNVADNQLKFIKFSPFSELEYLDVSNNNDLDSLIISSKNIRKIVCTNTKLNQQNIQFVDKDIKPQIVC